VAGLLNRTSGQMMYHKWRIVWSVGCGLICLLLIALWVRSYWKIDFIWVPSPGPTQFISGRGTLSTSFPNGIRKPVWSFITVSIAEMNADLLARGRKPSIPRRLSPLGFELTQKYLAISYLYPVILFGILASFVWIRWSNRFRLRTLLVGMTFVAIALGLLVFLANK
jgi:hypothetical protein